jgi:hypothetical protein
MEFYDFPSSWECHHPNWRTRIFPRGRSTTNQRSGSFFLVRWFVMMELWWVWSLNLYLLEIENAWYIGKDWKTKAINPSGLEISCGVLWRILALVDTMSCMYVQWISKSLCFPWLAQFQWFLQNVRSMVKMPFQNRDVSENDDSNSVLLWSVGRNDQPSKMDSSRQTMAPDRYRDGDGSVLMAPCQWRDSLPSTIIKTIYFAVLVGTHLYSFVGLYPKQWFIH